MPIEFACSECRLRYSVKDELAGKTAKCGKCGHRMRIPQPTVAAAPSSATAANAATASKPAPAARSTAVKPPAAPPRPAAKSTAPTIATNTVSWLDEELETEQPVVAKPRSAGPSCPACGKPLADKAVLCVSCGYDTRTGAKRETSHEIEGAEPQKSKVRKVAGAAGSLLRGTLFSFIGAMLGAVLWGGIAYLTDWSFGILAWALGGMAGYGMALGHEDNDGTLAGIIAACMSLVGIVAAKILIIILVIGAIVGEAVNEFDAAENLDPLAELRDEVATELADQKLRAKGLDPEEVTLEQWDESYNLATADVKNLDEAALNTKLAEIEKAHEAAKAAEEKAAAEQLAANPPPFATDEEDSGSGAGFFALLLLLMFRPLEILFVIAAVGTAYKVGSGQMTD